MVGGHTLNAITWRGWQTITWTKSRKNSFVQNSYFSYQIELKIYTEFSNDVAVFCEKCQNYFNGLVKGCIIFNELAMEILHICYKPSIWQLTDNL